MTEYTDTQQRLNDLQGETLDCFALALSESDSRSGYNMVSSWVSVKHDDESLARFAINIVVTSDKSTIKCIWDFMETLAKTGQFGDHQKVFKEQLTGMLTTEEYHGID